MCVIFTCSFLQGLGTADNTLIRIMVSRAEIDMLDIREFFRLSYEKSLYNMIKVSNNITLIPTFPSFNMNIMMRIFSQFGVILKPNKAKQDKYHSTTMRCKLHITMLTKVTVGGKMPVRSSLYTVPGSGITLLLFKLLNYCTCPNKVPWIKE